MAPSPQRGRRVPAIIVHGGAGAAPADRDELREPMRAAVQAGWTALAAGGTSLDAVEQAVRVLEDHPRFNAGRGSVLNEAGAVQMDASIMEGDRLACGAVAAVSRVANPVTLARRVLEDGRHVLLVADGAEAFAHASGLPACDPATLVTERQRRRLMDRRVATATGTVGAVALDRIAPRPPKPPTAAHRQAPRRVGDSALIGCGTMRTAPWGGSRAPATARPSSEWFWRRRALEYLKEADDPDYAFRVAVDLLVEEGRGEGGRIVVDGAVARGTRTRRRHAGRLRSRPTASGRAVLMDIVDLPAVEAARPQLRDAIVQTRARTRKRSRSSPAPAASEAREPPDDSSFKERRRGQPVAAAGAEERRRGASPPAAGNTRSRGALHAARLGVRRRS